MKFTFTLCLSLLFFNISWSQIMEKTNIRLYEHHSSVPGLPPFSGEKSGYDFVKMKYTRIHNDSQDPISANERSNIDMHEFYTEGGPSFSQAGFTSGDVKGGTFGGNNTTLFSKAPSGFNYGTISSIAKISNAYNSASATKTISRVAINDVYIARLRGTNNYVAIKITGLKVLSVLSGSDDENYFDFSFKYSNEGGTDVVLAIDDFKQNTQDVIAYPNPVINQLTFNGLSSSIIKATIHNTTGSIERMYDVVQNTIDFSVTPAGVYFVKLQFEDGTTLIKKVIKI